MATRQPGEVKDEGTPPQLGDEEVIDLDAKVQNEDEEDEDSDADAAMLAGYAKVNEGKPIPKELRDDAAAGERKKRASGSDEDDEGDEGNDEHADDDQAEAAKKAEEDEDRIIFGGLTAKQITEKLAKADAQEKSIATLAGKVGHLSTLINQAGAGQPITKDKLARISAEFGEEYAEALAEDLNAAGFGRGVQVDDAAVEAKVQERVEQVKREVERKLVKREHPDFADYFNADGKQHTAFLTWARAQPNAQEILSTWDSDVLVPALTSFKTEVGKAAKDAAARSSRLQRGTVPTTGASREAAGPAFDPVEYGYQQVAGKRRTGAGGRTGARGR